MDAVIACPVRLGEANHASLTAATAGDMVEAVVDEVMPPEGLRSFMMRNDYHSETEEEEVSLPSGETVGVRRHPQDGGRCAHGMVGP